ncbi:MAG: hypothetical protein K6E13_03550 [Lachnospiraceae bacterium]|nr:hypothetical protein [Lachnospiraceae bacterium]
MMDYHLMYNDLIDKTNALFSENAEVMNRIYKMIGYYPMKILEKADEREMLVRETNKKFCVVCGFLRDFIERNYVSRIKLFRSYSGLLQAYDLIERFVGAELAPLMLEGILSMSLAGEKLPVQNLFQFFIYDVPVDKNVALQRLVIFIRSLEETKRFNEARGSWGSDEQSLDEYYSGWFIYSCVTEWDEMDSMFLAIREEDAFRWYLRSVIYPIVMQKFENTIFDAQDIKSDSWRRAWVKIKNISDIDGDTVTIGESRYSLENEDTIKMIIKDAYRQYYTDALRMYHPMWIFGSKLYWDVLYDYLNNFQQDFEMYQLQEMMQKL